MENITRILVADDLARDEKTVPIPALRLAADVADGLNAKEIHLVHTYRLPNLSAPQGSINLIEAPYVEAMAKCLEQEAQAMLSQKPHLRLLSAVEKGDPVEVLLNDIQSHGCQMVVLQTHARKGLKRALLGSVAEEVMRRSPVPVLTINPHAELSKSFHPRKILVPVDFAEESEASLDLATDFAERFEAKLLLVHVIQEWVYPMVQSASLLAGGVVFPLERDLKELGNQRDADLRKLTDSLRARGFNAEMKLIERAASVSQALLDVANGEGCDLVVMSHRHASRFEYLIEGSVSRDVAREAHCPVVTVAN